MENKVKSLISACGEECKNADSPLALGAVKAKYLGKSGLLTALLQGMRDLPPEERPAAGKIVNAARESLEELFLRLEDEFRTKAINEKIAGQKIDVTLPVINPALKRGSLHPLTKIKNEIIDIFSGLGFSVKEGPEVETDYYCFQALNIPKDHPARDMQDTFFISENIVLRTHTSPNQVRVMEKEKPPIKIICPGAVYRNDDDATHSPMFNQIEGLVVDKHITMCDLMGTLEIFTKSVFGPNSKIRFRPSYFPFTEPSVEVDMSCTNCCGVGCKVCKGTGWMEILGAGMVNPKVLEYAGVDSNVYGGFAFGLGIDRIAMIKYGIPDIRLLFENDIRLLKQFS